MSPYSQPSQILLKVFSLVIATVLFIAMAEHDARHDAHQRWLAETREHQATRLVNIRPERANVLDRGFIYGSHGQHALGDGPPVQRIVTTTRSGSERHR